MTWEVEAKPERHALDMEEEKHVQEKGGQHDQEPCEDC